MEFENDCEISEAMKGIASQLEEASSHTKLVPAATKILPTLVLDETDAKGRPTSSWSRSHLHSGSCTWPQPS